MHKLAYMGGGVGSPYPIQMNNNLAGTRRIFALRDSLYRLRRF